METHRRTFNVDMDRLEDAFESAGEHLFTHYLDLQTGRVVVVPGYACDGYRDEDMDAAEELVEADPERYLLLESGTDLRPSVADARAFAGSVEDERFRRRLQAALEQHRGAFRRFFDLLRDESGESERWNHVRRQRLRENIVAWLAEQGINILYEPLPPWQPRNDTRRHLLAGAASFVNRVKRIEGVTRIALIGSIATPKRAPNDVDLLVTVFTDAIVPDIAAAGRKLKGHAQQLNLGADIFLANPAHHYLGRTCPWRECGPGIRTRCQAQHCGGHLYDDLHILKLSHDTIASPPIKVWPQVVVRSEVPKDVMEAFGIGG